MTTRTFQAETMTEALQLVQQAMGPDAVVISARDIPMGPAWQVWRKPGVEVISVSPDEIQNIKNTNSKDQQPTRIIRPDRSGNGVEFIEEPPSIEWAIDSPADSQVYPEPTRTSSIPQREAPQFHEIRNLWKPQYLHKEDVQTMNQILASRPRESYDDGVNNGVLIQPQKGIHTRIKAHTREENCPKVLQRLLDKLTSQGVEQNFITHLKELTLKNCSSTLLDNEVRVKEFLMNYMAANIVVNHWPTTEVPGRVLFFVGLSGCGKTNSLAKMAVFYSSLLRKKVVWVCADTIRTGAITEARTFVEAIGIPMELVYTAKELSAVVERYKDADLILIDTPGFNPSTEEQEVELGSYMMEIPEAQILLVTSATAKETDALHCYDAIKYFDVKGSILSKMDETSSYGSLFDFARKSHLPLSFFTSSRKASTGLKVADADLLVDALFRGRW
ncbi:MAG: hypothetical protein ABFD14_03465 [Anaerolineaceae bacterium]